MENMHNQSPVRLYETPAVIYEATLVAHAGVSSVEPCNGSPNDLLDVITGN
jgi:hypothetical protein